MNKIKVVKKDRYYTAVAIKNILKREVILKLQGTISSTPNKYSIQIGEKEHLHSFSENPQDELSYFRFLNHSCSPNSYFDIPDMSLVALTDVAANDEVFFHYCTTEYEMAHPFLCLCKSENCLLEIKGFDYLSNKNKKELFVQLALYLKKIEIINL